MNQGLTIYRSLLRGEAALLLSLVLVSGCEDPVESPSAAGAGTGGVAPAALGGAAGSDVGQECSAIESSMLALLEARQECQGDDDCTTVSSPCLNGGPGVRDCGGVRPVNSSIDQAAFETLDDELRDCLGVQQCAVCTLYASASVCSQGVCVLSP